MRKNNREFFSIYDQLYWKLTYSFKNEELLREAFTRQSAIEEKISDAATRSYQRLEFLGDRVLNFFIVCLLIDNGRCDNREKINNLKIQCVANLGRMVQVAKSLGLNQYLIRGNSEPMVSDKMYSDALEALLGAIYLDSGFHDKKMLSIISRLFLPLIFSAQENAKDNLKLVVSLESKQEGSIGPLFNSLFLSPKLEPLKYFASGSYQFKKEVLGWDLESIEKRPFSKAILAGELKSRYSVDAKKDYYEQFIPLILEEARATLAAGFEAYQNSRADELHLFIINVNKAKNAFNTSVFKMKGRIPPEFEHGASNIGVLLIPDTEINHSNNTPIKLFGLASFQESSTEEAEKQFDIKIVVPEKSRDIFNAGCCQKDASWMVYVLGSLVTHQRMYEICTSKKKINIENQLLTGNLPPLPEVDSDEISNLSGVSHLNVSQRTAIARFLALNEGIQILQGPPGTGKTTTILALLKMLCQREQRVLVCASSNKGVQVIAQRFLDTQIEASMILVGSKRKLNPELKSIFLNEWGSVICDQLSEGIDLLKQLIESNSDVLPELIDQLRTIANRIKLHAPKFFHISCWDLIFSLPSPSIPDLEKIIPLLDQQRLMLLKAQSMGRNNQTNALEIELLARATVTFATLSTAGRKCIQEIEKFHVVLIDEASQSVEAETLIAMAVNPIKCLLVGDTKQLPAMVLSPLATKKGFQRSLMSRLVDDCQQPAGILRIQYRMHPEIRQWPWKQYYDGQICEEEKMESPGVDLPNMLAPCSFIDVKGTEELQGHSYRNKEEAFLIVKMLTYLNSRGIDLVKRVGIITFYAGQVNYLNHLIKNNPSCAGATINTVDGFQGDERDIIIISFVRSNERYQIGFLSDFRRLNVAITRARYALIMLGNSQALRMKKFDVAKLIDDMQIRGLLWSSQELNKVLAEKATLHDQSVWQSSEQQFEQRIQQLLILLKYRVNNINVLRAALTRGSAVEEKLSDKIPQSFQYRLLGEHILKLISTLYLFNHHSNYSEGQLHSALERLLVSENLAKIAKLLSLGEVVIRGRGELEMTQQMYVDALHAVLGAIYIDNSPWNFPTQVIDVLFGNKNKSTQVEAQESNPSRHVKYKTELCRFFKKSGQCTQGQTCSFAHGTKELKKRK